MQPPTHTAAGPLHGKVALVTGAGGMKGIGRAIALKLAAQGADIVLSDVQRPQADLPPREVQTQWRSIDSVGDEIEAMGRRCHRAWCDLTKSDQIERMVAEASTCFGHLDILVNNARAIIGRDQVPVHEISEDVWRHFIDINTTAVFLTIKFATQAMIAQGRSGRIINIASGSGKQGQRNMAAYCASKFGVIGLTQSAALDLAPHGITVNSVCPGAIDSDRMNYREQDLAKQQGLSLQEYRDRLVKTIAQAIPLGRIGTSEDIAGVTAFLAGPEASFITGQSYAVNGGTFMS